MQRAARRGGASAPSRAPVESPAKGPGHRCMLAAGTYLLLVAGAWGGGRRRAVRFSSPSVKAEQQRAAGLSARSAPVCETRPLAPACCDDTDNSACWCSVSTVQMVSACPSLFPVEQSTAPRCPGQGGQAAEQGGGARQQAHHVGDTHAALGLRLRLRTPGPQLRI